MPYRGRFAPSPTGPLHAGSLSAALASWLDARAHDGDWLVRIEDVDAHRCRAGADELILSQLARCGLHPDEPPTWQSRRNALYQASLERLAFASYPCGCSRSDIALALAAAQSTKARHAEQVYPGICRAGLNGKPARAIRLRTEAAEGGDVQIDWFDRRMGEQTQNLTRQVGDFVLRRADGLWAYQLAVVVDDADQGITDVVRGEDLADNTPRQIHLQTLLDVPRVRYLHTPLVRAADGEKLSKQHGAPALDLHAPVDALNAAAKVLGLAHLDARQPAEWLRQAVPRWKERLLAWPSPLR